jgi:single-strand DNA-binding protein
MAGSVDKVILVGNLGADPEVRSFQSGGRICDLRLATAENWEDPRTGKRKERTDWHRVIIFADELIDLARRHLRKGSKIYVEGQLRTRRWRGRNGVDHDTTEVVLEGPRAVLTLLDGVHSDNSWGEARTGGGGDEGVAPPTSRHHHPDLADEISDDNIPF